MKQDESASVGGIIREVKNRISVFLNGQVYSLSKSVFEYQKGNSENPVFLFHKIHISKLRIKSKTRLISIVV